MGYQCSVSRCTVRSQCLPLMRNDRIGLGQEAEEAKVDFQKTPSFPFCKMQISSLWRWDGSTYLWQYPRTLGVTPAWNKDLYPALGKTGAYRLLWLLLLSGSLLCNERFLARKARGIVLVFLIKHSIVADSSLSKNFGTAVGITTFLPNSHYPPNLQIWLEE